MEVMKSQDRHLPNELPGKSPARSKIPMEYPVAKSAPVKRRTGVAWWHGGMVAGGWGGDSCPKSDHLRIMKCPN